MLSIGTRLRAALFLLTILAGHPATLFAQENAKSLPEVTEHDQVIYPPLAAMARIQGQVLLRVMTDGHGVKAIDISKGHPLLVQSAIQNVRTWKFVDHTPGTFDVIFNYQILDHIGTFLEQPGVVRVSDFPEGGISSYSFPEKWNAHVRNAQGAVDANLTLWTYHSYEQEIDGYVTRSNGREIPIRKPHIDGDVLGFDTTLEDKYGQRLNFSMIGRMSGDKINGVFLNYWGAGGTWTAERAAKPGLDASSAPPANATEAPVKESDVAYYESPEYSYFANQAGIQGMVQLRVTTNGLSATKIDVESGNPFLARDAIENLRTWRFAKQAPRIFEVAYDYQLKAQEVEFLKEPGVVTVEHGTPLVNGSFAVFNNPPEIWQLELTSSRGNMHAKLSLVKNYDMPDGYVMNDVPGWTGKKREVIQRGHQDGDILGFDATVAGPDGKPLKVSLLGKKTRNKISGVFLDYSGTAGTWTAVRQSSHAKSAR